MNCTKPKTCVFSSTCQMKDMVKRRPLPATGKASASTEAGRTQA